MRERCVVDNRVFLLGLNQLYRQAIKWHERLELFRCARRVVETLGIDAAEVPVEGYYADDEQLTGYYRMMRALQEVDASRTPEVAGLPEFQRLRDVTCAPIHGPPGRPGRLLPVACDPLTQALIETRPDWTVEKLTHLAHARAQAADDISLVGLAARIRDAVVLAGLRETVVLHADDRLGRGGPEGQPKYEWKVDRELAEQAGRFIRAFNELFDGELPPAEPAQAERYFHAHEDCEIYGRCVHLGSNDAARPVLHYHWGVSDPREFTVQEFWHEEIWTTDRYRQALYDSHGRPPEL
jgi:hypothetical protein